MIYGNIFLKEEYGYIDQSKDFIYNLDKFETKETNILFITGYSGSGKSTLSRELAKYYNCELIEYDNISFNKTRDYSDQPLVKKFLNSPKGKLIKGKKDLDMSLKLFTDLVDWINENDYRVIIEGMQVFMVVLEGIITPDYFKKYAFIIKNTDMYTSTKRAITRDFIDKYDKIDFEIFKKMVKRVSNNIKYKSQNDKTLNIIKKSLL